jgi:hypothetical protein
MRWIALLPLLALAGCGSSSPALPVACTGAPSLFTAALASAPASVTLPGGTPISQCVAHAGDQLESVSFALTPVADTLAARAARDSAAALQLGYLIGAVERGAARAGGSAAELVRRVDQTGALPGAGAQQFAALQRGLAAGRSGG